MEWKRGEIERSYLRIGNIIVVIGRIVIVGDITQYKVLVGYVVYRNTEKN